MDKRTASLMQRLEVTWTDIHATDSGWHSKEEARDHSGIPVVSIGYLLEDTVGEIKLTDSYFPTDSDHIGTVIAIPKGVVTRVRRLRLGPD